MTVQNSSKKILALLRRPQDKDRPGSGGSAGSGQSPDFSPLSPEADGVTMFAGSNHPPPAAPAKRMRPKSAGPVFKTSIEKRRAAREARTPILPQGDSVDDLKKALMEKNIELAQVKARLLKATENSSLEGEEGPSVPILYETLLQRAHKRTRTLTDLLKEGKKQEKVAANFGYDKDSDVLRFRRILNELTDGLESVLNNEMLLGQRTEQLHVKSKELKLEENRRSHLETEIARIRSENTTLRNSLQSYMREASVELSLRNAEKIRSEKLAKQVVVLQDCVAACTEQPDKSLDPTGSKQAKTMQKTLTELMRLNTHLTRRHVELTKQNVMAQAKIKATTKKPVVESPRLNRVNPHQRGIFETSDQDDYVPVAARGATQLEKDFLTFLTESQGNFPFKFLDEMNDKQCRDLISFLAMECYGHFFVTRRIDQAVCESQRLTSLTEADEIMTHFAEVVMAALDCEKSTLWIVDTHKRVIVEGAERPASAWTIIHEDGTNDVRRVSLLSGVLGRCVSQQESIFCEDLSTEPGYYAESDGEGIATMIFVPIISNGVCVAVATAQNKFSGQLFTQPDALVMRSIAVATTTHWRLTEKLFHTQLKLERKTQLFSSSLELFPLMSKMDASGGLAAPEPLDMLRMLHRNLFVMFRARQVQFIYCGKRRFIRIYSPDEHRSARVDERHKLMGFVGVVEKDRKPVVIKDASSSRDYDSALDLPGRDWLFTLPILEGATLRGLIQFTCGPERPATYKGKRDVPGVFNEYDMKHLEISNQLGSTTKLSTIIEYQINFGLRV